MTENPKLIAAIDVGTNSFHLIIASVSSRGMLQVHQREKEIVRLGYSPTAKDMKKISPEALERGCEAMRNFTKLARSAKAEIYAAATSAVREADNRYIFLDRVKSETGVDISIISGDEEGRLIYVGAIHSLPIFKQNALIIDIGGGSTETIIGNQGITKFIYSAKLGSIRITKNFFPDFNSKPEQVKICREFIQGVWAPTLKRAKEVGFETAVGCSGTINTIVNIVYGLKGSRIPENTNGAIATKKELLDAIETIVSTKTVDERKLIPGMDSSRADIILGGALILERVILDLDIKNITISNFALREGLVFDINDKLKLNAINHNLAHLRYETIINLAQRYNSNMDHCINVRDIALSIFDDLNTIHKLDEYDREMLEAATYLHDIGYYIAHDKHHLHSYYLISQSVMPGFNNDEAEMIALVARYHRKSMPKLKHPEFSIISEEKQYKIRVMSGILRIAEGIDRRQLQIIKSARANIKDGEILISLYPDNNKIYPDIELWGASRRTDLLELSIGKKINFEIVE